MFVKKTAYCRTFPVFRDFFDRFCNVFFTFVSDFLFAQKVTDAEKKEQYYKEMM